MFLHPANVATTPALRCCLSYERSWNDFDELDGMDTGFLEMHFAFGACAKGIEGEAPLFLCTVHTFKGKPHSPATPAGNTKQ